MKPEIFEASLSQGSNSLYIQSGKKINIRNGAFIKLGSNDIFYRTESTEFINIKRKFKVDRNWLSIKGNYLYKISPNDNCEITFEEYQAYNIEEIGKNSIKYTVGEKLYAQGGKTSSSSGNLTGEYTEIEVRKIGPDYEITEAVITKPGLYITPPSNPVPVMNENGDLIEMDLEFDSAENISILERDIDQIKSEDNLTHLKPSYLLPEGVTEGELVISKQIISLDRAYASESFESELCEITFDYSPVNGIPLLPPHSIDPQTTYNEAIKIIDGKLLELDKRITRMENRNY